MCLLLTLSNCGDTDCACICSLLQTPEVLEMSKEIKEKLKEADQYGNLLNLVRLRFFFIIIIILYLMCVWGFHLKLN